MMEWRRRASGDYATGPHSWGRATISKGPRGWSLCMFAYGEEEGRLCDTLADAKARADLLLDRLWHVSQGRAKEPTRAEVEALVDKNGKGATRALLASWGVSWPPPRGWKRELLRKADEAEKRDRRR